FYANQQRIVFRNNGKIDPTDIGDYIAADGYAALAKALTSMTPEQVIEQVTSSGLRGRGGGGFPTGQKWQICRSQPGEQKYVICNGDEGDPGAFMDRSIMEGDPHSVLEGMTIGAYAIGASRGYVYVRAEYPLAVSNLNVALDQSRTHGLLGEDILGSGFGFDVEIIRGAGAFVCGEETGMIASIQGDIGSPRQRPPYPAQSGLWEKPTNINNVETWANVPVIIDRGSEWFAGIGTAESKGTKVFSVSGDVKKPGVYELVMGSRLRELVEGLALAENIKMVQVGGATGRIIPGEMLDTPLSFETILGAGGITVFDESRDVIDVVYRTLEFLAEESCGKCTPCREG
ncbi:hypothetical protein LCGC14_3106200, partial [marine sediment metagenome]